MIYSVLFALCDSDSKATVNPNDLPVLG